MALITCKATPGGWSQIATCCIHFLSFWHCCLYSTVDNRDRWEAWGKSERDYMQQRSPLSESNQGCCDYMVCVDPRHIHGKSSSGCRSLNPEVKLSRGLHNISPDHQTSASNKMHYCSLVSIKAISSPLFSAFAVRSCLRAALTLVGKGT